MITATTKETFERDDAKTRKVDVHLNKDKREVTELEFRSGKTGVKTSVEYCATARLHENNKMESD